MINAINKIIIVIPVYKASMDRFEELSFRQCLKVLGRYPICLVTFEALDISSYCAISNEKSVTIQRQVFDKSFFVSIDGYNKLCLSEDFYRRFQDYEYLLIYQLDAYVFKDNVDDWCNLGYDYIGAPLPTGVLQHSSMKISEILSRPVSLKIGFNGGASLRKVRSFIKTLECYCQDVALLKSKGIYEDIIFSYLFSEQKPIDYESVLHFSIESYPQQSYKQINNQKPMLCHAWYKWDSEYYDNIFWYKIIMPSEYYRIKIKEFIRWLKRILRQTYHY